MDKRFAFLITVLLAMTVLVPAMAAAEPTREGDVEITSIEVSGTMAPTGELASGMIYFSIDIDNAGLGQFIDFIDFTVNITYSANDTVVFFDTIEEMVFIPAESQSSIELLNRSMEEGEYHIMVNATIDTNMTQISDSFIVKDVVDMSVVDIGFDKEIYIPGEQILPMCNISYQGNVMDYADTLEANLVIDLIGEANVTVYDETITILTPASPGVDPGKYWILSFPQWTPNESGDYKATVMVYYDNTDESNNEDIVLFAVDNPISVEGYVMTDGMDPIPGVTVTLSTDPEMETMSNDMGHYHFMNVTEGSYILEFTKQWVTPYETNVTIVDGETAVVNATMSPLMIGGLRGTVTLPDGTPAQGALIVVTMESQPLFTINTNSTGFYQFDSLPSGNATVTASFSGYMDADDSIVLASQTWNTLDLQLGEIPFEVTFSVPDNEPGLSILGSISVYFTRPIDRTSIDDTTLVMTKLTTAATVDVVYSFTDNDETVVLTPSEPLEYSTDYQLEVTSWITDIYGDYFPGPVVIGFSTENQIIEVQVIDTYPVNDGNEIPLDAAITAKFSVPMVGSTINSTTFIMIAPGGKEITAIVSYNAGTRTATLTPVADLDYGTRYSISLFDTILADDENYWFGGYSWSFETEVLVTKGILKGTVLNEDQLPFEPAQVDIILTTGIDTTETSRPKLDGSFEIIDLDSGLWTLTIKVEGYDDYTQQVTISAGQTTEITSDIVMTPAEVEEDDDGGDNMNVWLIAVIFLIVIFIIIVLYLMYNKRTEPVEAEEVDRRPSFGRGRTEPVYHDGYDDYAEGEFLCPACGSVVEGEDAICPACGAEFEEDLFECPECGTSIPADVEECPDCGALFEDEAPEDEEDDYYDEDEDVDITEDFEVEDMDDEDLPISQME